MENESQQQKKSSVNDVIRTVSNARKIISTARSTINIIQALNPVALSAAATFVLILLLVAIFLGLLGGMGGLSSAPSEQSGGSSFACEDLGGKCQSSACTLPSVLDQSGATCIDSTSICCVPQGVYTCLDGDYLACLKNDFNIVVTNASDAVLKKIFTAFAFVSKSNAYLALLKSGGNTLYINDVSGLTCHARQIDENHITLYDGGCASGTQPDFTHFMVHESGHIIAARNSRLYQAYPHTSLYQSDNTCFQYSTCGSLSGYFLKSYTLRFYCPFPPWGSDCLFSRSEAARYESFAEGIADYLFPSDGYSNFECSQKISSFNTSCPNTFSWLKTNVFGGYTFY